LVAGLIGPRVAFFLTWVFTDRVSIAFHNGWFLPLLGLIVLPWTSLAYVFAYAPIFGVSALGWFIVVLGFLLDIATYAGGGSRNRYTSSTATA
jgi:hypothetical protein